MGLTVTDVLVETVAVPKLAVRVETAAGMLDVGRSKICELIASGELPSFKLGGSRRIAVEDIEAYVRSQLTRDQTLPNAERPSR